MMSSGGDDEFDDTPDVNDGWSQSKSETNGEEDEFEETQPNQ